MLLYAPLSWFPERSKTFTADSSPSAVGIGPAGCLGVLVGIKRELRFDTAELRGRHLLRDEPCKEDVTYTGCVLAYQHFSELLNNSYNDAK